MAKVTTFSQLQALAARTKQELDAVQAAIPSKTSELTNDSGFITKAVSDLTNYYTKTNTYTRTEIDNKISADLSGYVQKETGKGLSSNDYTSTEKTKLAGIQTGATKVEASTTNGHIKINGTDTTVYTLPSDVLKGSVATDAEVTTMLDTVFGAED